MGKSLLINTIFKWKSGGSSVFITGTWDSWKKKTPLKKSGNEFTVILPLMPGFFKYKFTIDNSFKHKIGQMSKLNFCKTIKNFKTIKRLDKEIVSSDSLLGDETETYFYSPKLLNDNLFDLNRNPQPVPTQLLISIYSKLDFTRNKSISAKISPEISFSKMVFFNHLIFYKSFSTLLNLSWQIFFAKFRFKAKICTFFYFKFTETTIENISNPIKILFKS